MDVDSWLGVKQEKNEISAETVRPIAETEKLQTDLWGNEMATIVREDSFIIAYPDRDSRFDVVNLSRYFDQEQVNVTSLYDHDLVVDHRHLLTLVGKEVPEDVPRRPLLPPRR